MDSRPAWGLPPSHFSDGAIGLEARLFRETQSPAPPSPSAGPFVWAAPHLRAAAAMRPSRAAVRRLHLPAGPVRRLCAA